MRTPARNAPALALRQPTPAERSALSALMVTERFILTPPNITEAAVPSLRFPRSLPQIETIPKGEQKANRNAPQFKTRPKYLQTNEKRFSNRNSNDVSLSPSIRLSCALWAWPKIGPIRIDLTPWG